LILLDANALISLLRSQPAEAEVSALLRQGDCAVPAACLSEVVDRLIRMYRVDPAAVSERLGALIDEAIPVVPANQGVAWRAGELHAAHYHRTNAALSLADCLLLASAEPGDEIATSDAAVIATARKLGIEVISLRDSGGRRPRLG
jgi:predicted nucleic acid-binding protein